MTYDDYSREYDEGQHGWEEIEGRMIQVMLQEYLAVMGIVDVAVDPVEDGYGCNYFEVPFYRLTKLGAHVLGVYDDFTVERQVNPAVSGFIIQPNFEIVISEGASKQIHQMFFERFAEKVADDVVTVYRIDFPSFIQAFNQGIKISEIIAYMKEHNEGEFPDKVWATLQDWDKKSGKIRIRQATIVETDDELLRLELMNSKPIRKHMVNELQNAFEIDAYAASKVKKEIEKRNYFCGQ